ncbi:MAG TPA: hypothetical protein VN426_10880 [Syntrophomonadaceae bacterium]|nr:hypothetical protein [Syntrophomonadaceae bacterium]
MREHRVNCVVLNYPSRIGSYKWRRAGISIIQVENLDQAYIRLAKFYSSQFPIPRIEVIGSSGKTTTKEMMTILMPTLIPRDC